MAIARDNVCNLEAPDARAALHGLQSIAQQMPEKYRNINFPLFGGSYVLATLFLAGIENGKLIEGRIQQTSPTALEASVMGHPADEKKAVRELIIPLLETYKKHYPDAPLKAVFI